MLVLVRVHIIHGETHVGFHRGSTGVGVAEFEALNRFLAALPVDFNGVFILPHLHTQVCAESALAL